MKIKRLNRQRAFLAIGAILTLLLNSCSERSSEASRLKEELRQKDAEISNLKGRLHSTRPLAQPPRRFGSGSSWSSSDEEEYESYRYRPKRETTQ
jgi:hypothetical protein